MYPIWALREAGGRYTMATGVVGGQDCDRVSDRVNPAGRLVSRQEIFENIRDNPEDGLGDEQEDDDSKANYTVEIH